MSNRHKDVEYAVSGREEKVFKDFEKAAVAALTEAMLRGEAVFDVLVYSKAGARFVGGDDAVEQYKEDPEASVFDRFEITVNNVGRVA